MSNDVSDDNCPRWLPVQILWSSKDGSAYAVSTPSGILAIQNGNHHITMRRDGSFTVDNETINPNDLERGRKVYDGFCRLVVPTNQYNVAPACERCNIKKGAMDPLEWIEKEGCSERFAAAVMGANGL